MDRANEMYEAASIGFTWEKLQARLRELNDERTRLLALKSQEQDGHDPTATSLTPAQWTSLREKLDEVWQSGEICFDRVKSAYLRALGLKVDVAISVRQPNRRRSGNDRQYPGPVTVTVHIDAVSRVGTSGITLTETEEQFKEYSHWRASFGNLGGRPRKKPIHITEE